MFTYPVVFVWLYSRSLSILFWSFYLPRWNSFACSKLKQYCFWLAAQWSDGHVCYQHIDYTWPWPRCCLLTHTGAMCFCRSWERGGEKRVDNHHYFWRLDIYIYIYILILLLLWPLTYAFAFANSFYCISHTQALFTYHHTFMPYLLRSIWQKLCMSYF
jgi:hypothetical protein